MRIRNTASRISGYFQYPAVLWTEFERIRIFWLDPNPKKKFGFRFEFWSRHCCKIQIFCEKSHIKHLKEKNVKFFRWKTFFSVVQIPVHIYSKSNERHHFKKFRFNILGNPNPKPNSNPKKMWILIRIRKNECGSTTQVPYSVSNRISYSARHRIFGPAFFWSVQERYYSVVKIETTSWRRRLFIKIQRPTKNAWKFVLLAVSCQKRFFLFCPELTNCLLYFYNCCARKSLNHIRK
jgi:hypothetical protein